MRTFEDICLPYDQKVVSIAKELREFLIAELPNIQEEMDTRQNKAFYFVVRDLQSRTILL